MAREGMRLLSTHRTRSIGLNKGRSDGRKRDTGPRQDHEINISDVVSPYNGRSIRDSVKAKKTYDGARGSYIQSSYNPDRESLSILRGSKNMEFSRPRTSTGPSRFRHDDIVEEESTRRPSTSHGKKSIDVHSPPLVPAKSSLKGQNIESVASYSPRYTLKRISTTAETKGRSQLAIRAVSASPATQSVYQDVEPIGIALGSPPSSPKFARSMSAKSTAPMYSRGSTSSVLPQHVITLESSQPNEMSDYMIPAQEPAQRGWKKLFGRGLFNKRQMQRSPRSVDHSLESTISHPSEAVKRYEKTYMTPPTIVEPLNTSDSDALDFAIVQDDFPEIQTNNAPHLDVHIPDVQMERYSVMFDSLLKTNSRTPLYARRKSRDVSMTIGQKISENPSATPQLCIKSNNRDSMTLGLVNRSPLWLFPATPKTPSTPQTPNRPRAMTSPLNPVVDHLYPNDTNVDTKARPTSDLVPSILLMLQSNHSASDRSEGVLLSGKLQGPLSPLSVMSQDSELDTPVDENSEEAPWVRKFDFQDEHEWSALSTPLRPRTPSPTEMYSSTTSTKQEAEELIATAARVSIARQISISQRQLLLPIVQNPERFIKSPTTSASTFNSPIIEQHSMSNDGNNDDLGKNMAPTSAVATTPPRRISDIQEASYVRIGLEISE